MMNRLARLVLLTLAAAWLSACTARDIPYPTLEARYASPASRYLDLPGGLRVHYRDQGPRDATAIVLVHGFSASLHAWEPWVQRLSGDYRVVSLDLPGHGLTRAPEGYAGSLDGNIGVVDQIATTLGLGRFVLAGNSMGGAVAWNYALAHPERLEALVLVDAAGWPQAGRREGGPVVFKLLGNPVGRAFLRNVDPALMAEDGLKKAYFDARLVTPELVKRYVELARAPGHRAILTTQRPGPRTPVTPATFGAIRVPTLVMTGEDDALIAADNARGLARAIPGARLIAYPGVGHVPMEQIPERSAQDLRAFLEGLKLTGG